MLVRARRGLSPGRLPCRPACPAGPAGRGRGAEPTGRRGAARPRRRLRGRDSLGPRLDLRRSPSAFARPLRPGRRSGRGGRMPRSRR
jgi:hypothetical protein